MIRSALLSLTLILTAAQFALAAPASGMLLGIYAFPNWQGLRVTGTIPGYSAEGKLFRHDVLTRVTADGINVYPTRSLQDFEFAKDQIGPNRPAALEVIRPGQGKIYLWVEFIPVGGGPAAAAATVKAKVMTEQQKPGARRLFEKGRNGGFGKPGQPPRRDSGNAGDLFGN